VRAAPARPRRSSVGLAALVARRRRRV